MCVCILLHQVLVLSACAEACKVDRLCCNNVLQQKQLGSCFSFFPDSWNSAGWLGQTMTRAVLEPTSYKGCGGHKPQCPSAVSGCVPWSCPVQAWLSREPLHQIQGFQTSKALAINITSSMNMVFDQSWDDGSGGLGLLSRHGGFLQVLALVWSTKLTLLTTRNGQRCHAPQV